MNFSPLECISGCNQSCERIALIILNKDNRYDDDGYSVFQKLWKKSVFRACADGGANFVYDFHEANANGVPVSEYLPHLVSGDLDSIRQEVRKYYEDSDHTEVIPTPDQDETDFTKCLKIIGEKLHDGTIKANLVVALGGRQNRFDHSNANISTLFRAQKILPENVRMCLIYGESYICLLPEGKSTMQVKTGSEGSWCGLIPIGHPVIASTTGLKWNLDHHKLEFGQLVSTSNELDGSGQVTVETDRPLIWTMGYSSLG